MANKKIYQKFTDKELDYLYLNCDVDANYKLFRQIEKKIRKQIKGYNEFDQKKRGGKHNGHK